MKLVRCSAAALALTLLAACGSGGGEVTTASSTAGGSDTSSGTRSSSASTTAMPSSSSSTSSTSASASSASAGRKKATGLNNTFSVKLPTQAVDVSTEMRKSLPPVEGRTLEMGYLLNVVDETVFMALSLAGRPGEVTDLERIGFCKGMVMGMKDPQSSPMGETTVDGSKALGCRAQATGNDGKPVVMLGYVTKKGGKLYGIVTGGKAAKESAHLAALKDVSSSWHWTT